MNELNKITVFRNYEDTIPRGNIPVYSFCINVVNGDYKTEIEQLRTIQDKEQRDKIKSKLPAVTISGTFAARTSISITQHSGFVAMDFDSKHNPQITDWPALRDSLSGFPEVYFSALSASGKGVFLIVPILCPDQHLSHYLALINDFKAIGLNADGQCKNVSRLRGISYDPDATINHDAKTYKKVFRESPRHYPSHSTKQGDRLPALIEKISCDITGEYKTWYEIGSALANEYGEMGRGYFHKLSAFYSGYSPKECDKKYDSLLRRCGKYRAGTIFHYAKQHGIILNN